MIQEVFNSYFGLILNAFFTKYKFTIIYELIEERFIFIFNRILFNFIQKIL